ncbi:plasmid mobilization protein [Clostridium arbusti]|uniref:plasmid mobilization protein n=1 Tax=Clostridium arbusti TaxID=1137848 RepID=UPI000287F025|nr:plasmid mobilization relaxosome protein MobC [Clostridium arbusti]
MGKNRIRDIKLNFFVDEFEKDIIDDKAKSAQLNRSEYLRTMAIDGMIIQQDLKTVRDLSVELNRIGNNINQIARVVNTNQTINKKDFEDLQKMMDTICEKIADVL